MNHVGRRHIRVSGVQSRGGTRSGSRAVLVGAVVTVVERLLGTRDAHMVASGEGEIKVRVHKAIRAAGGGEKLKRRGHLCMRRGAEGPFVVSVSVHVPFEVAACTQLAVALGMV